MNLHRTRPPLPVDPVEKARGVEEQRHREQTSFTCVCTRSTLQDRKQQPERE